MTDTDPRGRLIVDGPPAQDDTARQRACPHEVAELRWCDPGAYCAHCGAAIEQTEEDR